MFALAHRPSTSAAPALLAMLVALAAPSIPATARAASQLPPSEPPALDRSGTASTFRGSGRPGLLSGECGRVAVATLAEALQAGGEARTPADGSHAPPGGFTLAHLQQMAGTLGLRLEAVQCPDGSEWPVPSIMHWREGHFSALLARQDDQFLLVDPTLGGRLWVSADFIGYHGSGSFLAPANRVRTDWPRLTASAMALIRGGERVYPPIPHDDDDEDCPTDEEMNWQPTDPDSPAEGAEDPCPGAEECPPGHGDEGCGGAGMPVWRVSEPFINLWVKDVPLFYTMSDGRVMPLVLRYKQRAAALSTNVFGFGNSWECSWLSYFEGNQDGALGFQVPGGGRRGYARALDGEFRGAHSELVTTVYGDDGSVGFQISFRSAALNRYVTHFDPSDFITLQLLSEKQDPFGRSIRFHYTTNASLILLSRVVDYDGKSSQLSYTNTQFPRFVTSVQDPYGRRAHFHYSTNGNLVRIVDVQGITNHFQYDANGFLTALTTPYGTTRFQTWASDADDMSLPISRSILVTQPNGDRQAFAYHESIGTESVPAYYGDVPQPDTEVPEALAVGPLNQRSSFFWDSQHMSQITNSWPVFSPANYRLARWRHWDVRVAGSVPRLGTHLLMERRPSPDGQTEGHRVWYAYTSDPFSDLTPIWPTLRAERLPDGAARYTQWQRNEWGRPTRVESTFSEAAGIGKRQTFLSYDETGRNLTEVWGPELDEWQQPRLLRSYRYNTHNQLTNAINALGEITTYTYNFTNRNLTSGTYPSGLRITNALANDGFVTRRLWVTTLGTPLATNNFTWNQGKVSSRSDARGLVVTNYWDALGRLTGRCYPDGSTISNWYTKLDGVPFTNSNGALQLMDLTRIKDRLGNFTTFTYSPLRQIVATTNALSRVTRFAWCNCGALESVTDPLANTVRFERDLQGRVTTVVYPGNRWIRVTWDDLGRPTNISDSRSSVFLGYNHQGLCTRTVNSLGMQAQTTFDLMDRMTQLVLPTGRTYEFSYDPLGRISRRADGPQGGIETFGYSPGVPGFTAHTNQLGAGVVLLSYDAFGRVSRHIAGRADAGTFVAASTNTFTYNAAGDLLSLADGLNHITTWQYDVFGRPVRKNNAAGWVVWTNGYDASSRLTAHWTPGRSNLTRYAYDAVGNLTNLAFSNTNTPSVSLAYDAADRLVTMTDAVGSTRFVWDNLGQLASEDGPWGSDAVSFGRNPALGLQTLSIQQPGTSFWVQTNQYDAGGRLTNLTSPAGAFAYAYRDATPQKVRVSLPNGAFTTNTFDPLGRLLASVLKSSGGTVLEAHEYAYNLGHQRTRQTFKDGNLIDYAYDALGQLSGAVGREANGSARLHEQFAYAYDAAGNLAVRTNGNDTVAFTVDLLNQLLTSSRNSQVTVAGMTTPPATAVSVNGQPATLYADKTFARPNVPLADGQNTLTAVAQDAFGRWDTNVVTATLPSTTAFQYDANGNLVSDGRRRFSYDDCDQLVSVVVTNSPVQVSRSEFVYDGLGRQRIRREKTWQEGQWVLTDEIHTVYAGLLPVEERDVNNLPRCTYTRGPDLSGRFQRAGGIGGLLAMTRSGDAGSEHYFYHADGSGNITALLDLRQNAVARYNYDPFGNLQGLAGPLAEANPYRFSSKQFHPPSGLYYYGFRFYDPALQRWVNADPLGEEHSPNLYQFAGNNPAALLDPFGLTIFHYDPGQFGWLPGPDPYVWGDNWWDKYIVAPWNNLSASFMNASYWTGLALATGAEALDGFIGYLEDKIGARGLTEAMPLTLAKPKFISRLKAASSECSNIRRVVRYVGEGEANVAREKRCIPNVDRAGNPKYVYVTADDPVKTVKIAEENYQIGAKNPTGPTASPTHAIIGDSSKATFISAGNVEGGHGSELLTLDEIPVIEIIPLK